VVTVDHLRAALAGWQFAEESAWYLFGTAIRDDDASLIAFIRDKGGKATRTGVSHQHFHRNKTEEAIDLIRDRLRAEGRIAVTTEHSDGKAGRPTEVWSVPEGIMSFRSFCRRGADYIATLDALHKEPYDITTNTTEPLEEDEGYV
jgi:hypothetical protein